MKHGWGTSALGVMTPSKTARILSTNHGGTLTMTQSRSPVPETSKKLLEIFSLSKSQWATYYFIVYADFHIYADWGLVFYEESA